MRGSTHGLRDPDRAEALELSIVGLRDSKDTSVNEKLQRTAWFGSKHELKHAGWCRGEHRLPWKLKF